MVFVISHAQNGYDEPDLYDFLTHYTRHADWRSGHVCGTEATAVENLQENPQVLECYIVFLHKWMGKNILYYIALFVDLCEHKNHWNIAFVLIHSVDIH